MSASTNSVPSVTEQDEWLELERIRDHWKQFALSSKRLTLDKQGLDIAEQREKSSNARKNLSQETKTFKKLKDNEKMAKFGKLLKSYQDEIDNLTKRSLAAETAFLELYNELREAPDPCEAMSAALVAKDELKSDSNNNNNNSNNNSEQIEKLKQQLQNYEEEFKHLKDQDVKIHQLEKKVAEYETNMSKKIDMEVETQRTEWTREKEEFLVQYREKEHLMISQLQQAKQELDNIQQLYQNAQNELFNFKNKNEEADANRQAQFETMTEEISQLNHRIVSLQSENEILKDRLKKAASEQSEQDDADDDELVNAQREAQMKQLQHTVQLLQSSVQSKTEQTEELQTQLTEAKSKISNLEEALAKRPTDELFNQLKERARMLEELSFSAVISNPDEISSKSVEQLLAEKNRYLEDQITRTKIVASDKEEQLKKVTEELIQLRQKTEEQSQLIIKLENDLASNNSTPLLSIDTSSILGNISNSTTPTSTTTTSSTTVVNASRGDTGTAPVVSKDQDQNTMLQIVSEQRNRFKKRMHEMEEENQLLNQKLARLQSDITTLQKDNVSLYEKIRFLQSYNSTNQQQNDGITWRDGNSSNSSGSSSSSVARGSSRSGGASNSNHHIDIEDPIGNKYKKLYEQKLDPFKQFHKSEKDSEYRKLNSAEKITFLMTRLMMATKYSRLFVFFYCVALHLLVFIADYEFPDVNHVKKQ